MPQPAHEFELKLDLTAKELDQLAGNPKLSSGRGRAQKTLRSIYYDTPDHRLHAQGIVLRVRDDGQGFMQAVKLGNGDLRDGVSDRVEIEDRLENGQPSTICIHDKHVRRKVQKAIRGSALTQAFETNVTRTTYRLRTRGSIVELALDRGETVAMNRRSEICEAELELIRGDPKHLLQMAQTLFAKTAIRPAPMTKAERGYRLLLKTRAGEKAGPVQKPGPVYARAPAIEKGQTCGVAFAEILRAAREQIVSNRIAVLESDEPEAAHQLRIGLTRLRSAHRALEALPDSSPQLRQLETDARTISRAVGRLRDADVTIEDIFAPVAGKPPRQPGFDGLYEALKAHRDAMQTGARLALASEAWTRLLLALTLWPAMLERDPALQDPVEDHVDKLLHKRWKKAAKLGRGIESLEGEEQHNMRKSLKKLRYMAEFLAPFYPKNKVGTFVRRLKKLQDVFGYVNDVHMAAGLRDIAKAHSSEPAPLIAAGIVLAHHEAEAAEVWRRAPKAWHRLKASGPFWK
jgi:inorganic triphosphatase YgiF